MQSSSPPDGVRINKCLSSLSRRGADDAIAEGRVSVNGKVASAGMRIMVGDKVTLDGKLQKWEAVALAKKEMPQQKIDQRQFVYLKYWKPRGVTCTNNLNDPTNIITAGRFDLFPQRVFSVGRLDKDSTGLILLTSDGRVNNAILNPRTRNEKVYEVTVNRPPTDDEGNLNDQSKIEIMLPIIQATLLLYNEK